MVVDFTFIYATFLISFLSLAWLFWIHARQHVHILRNWAAKGWRPVHIPQGSRQLQCQADVVLWGLGSCHFWVSIEQRNCLQGLETRKHHDWLGWVFEDDWFWIREGNKETYLHHLWNARVYRAGNIAELGSWTRSWLVDPGHLTVWNAGRLPPIPRWRPDEYLQENHKHKAKVPRWFR